MCRDAMCHNRRQFLLRSTCFYAAALFEDLLLKRTELLSRTFLKIYRWATQQSLIQWCCVWCPCRCRKWYPAPGRAAALPSAEKKRRRRRRKKKSTTTGPTTPKSRVNKQRPDFCQTADVACGSNCLSETETFDRGFAAADAGAWPSFLFGSGRFILVTAESRWNSEQHFYHRTLLWDALKRGSVKF